MRVYPPLNPPSRPVRRSCAPAVGPAPGPPPPARSTYLPTYLISRGLRPRMDLPTYPLLCPATCLSNLPTFTPSCLSLELRRSGKNPTQGDPRCTCETEIVLAWCLIYACYHLPVPYNCMLREVTCTIRCTHTPTRRCRPPSSLLEECSDAARCALRELLDDELGRDARQAAGACRTK